MPSLVWLGRAWRVGSDDFAFSSVLHAMLLAGSAALVACRVNTARLNCLDDCDGASVTWGRAMMGLFFANLVGAAPFLLTAVYSLRGGVFEISKRKAVPKLLYINTACIAWIFLLSCLGAKHAIIDGEASYCTRASTRHMLRGAIMIDLINCVLYIALLIVAFDPSGRRVYQSSSDYTNAWWNRFRICCCRFGKWNQAEDAYIHLAQVFAIAFRGYDIVPSDIAAGILLLHGYQSRSRRLLSRLVNYGPNPKGYHERLSSQARPAQRLTPEQRAWAHELQQYSRFFIAAYGWLLFEFQHFGSGLARLCCFDPCMCCRHHPGRHIGQSCFCDVAALLHETLIPEADVLLTSWENRVFKPVHYVAYDRSSDAVVIAIRGSMSIEDCVTDLAALPVTLSLRDTPPDVPISEYYAHGGMVRCAYYVLDNLCEHGILQQLLRGSFAGKKVVVLGHSLGAGVALILSAILWSDHTVLRNRLRCLAYAPPGGTVSKSLMEYQKGFVAAACMGYDMIPRLAQHTFDSFREAIFDVLAASAMNKNMIFMNVLRTSTIAKSFHPSTSADFQQRRSAESASLREFLQSTSFVPTYETQKLYNCSLMIHYVKVVEVCTNTWCLPGCQRCEEVYIPVVQDFKAVQMVLASPRMLTDHFPDRLFRIMQRSMELFDKGELDRFYVDDISNLAPCLEEAPMHYVESTPNTTETASLISYGAA
ncbi:Lipase (class 3) family protein [Leishmania donovani]|uniref:sn-1-specific diacylglycerol lipase n=3 Tax=Leishmania donovani species complex TaxID=38574 RepID=A4HXP2_LEIIN|nr:conserved hypothetical protein [Leishmania infantum JPCM5]XP_003860030.1 hypothetical protein, conserved [Leishmania donovani]CAC9479600.1 Lipase_(class_3)_-_putative [Leishmania infantum]AYU77942.1 Lipase (class 3), putative [Leishmania donovani]TPP53312.1 Lipase (class 3) family protein [Leishmania donovani]TPP55327.1 Lipase (class 3) family protein [Leishmania donovani]CAM67069.1 conserved hypothetical protein [Leishmania infantum JPCM5]|eukprot:XP_001464833.1 conserved hypothetical protein [Leishmania infantum JPCM5]